MSDMYAVINEYPRQFERGFRAAETALISKDIKEIVVSAVGYNAAVAEIINNLFQKELTTPLVIHQEFGLPHKINSQTLFIAISLCGHRAEVVSAAKAAYEAGAKLVVITTGGELEDFARERNLSLILFPKELPEWKFRMGQGIILATLAQVLINARILPPQTRPSVLEAATAIEKLYLTKLGQKLAEFTAGVTALIYSSARYAGLAKTAKILFNILLQKPCFTNSLTGLRYTEINSFNRKSYAKCAVLFLRDEQESTDTLNTIAELQAKLTANKTKQYTLDLPGQNQIEKTLATIMLFYWVIYWALQADNN